jgi:Trp operon repressor
MLNLENEPITDPEILESLITMKSSIEEGIQKLENDLTQFQQPSNETGMARKNSAMAPHWDQVIQFIQKDQEEEAICALIRVVQRLLDEKATKKTLAEKANKTYVDGLLEIVSSGIQKNFEASTIESMQTLNEKVTILQTKIANIRSFMENEMRDIEECIQSLVRPLGEDEKRDNVEESGTTVFTVQ